MYIYIYVYIYGVVLKCLERKWLLRRPWANLARFLRDHSPVWLFVWAYFRAPCWCSFSCSFLVCIDIHFLSIGFPSKSLNPKGHRRISKIFNSEHKYIYMYMYIYIFLLFYRYTLYFHSMLVFLKGRHGLRVNFGPEACAFLARSLRRIGLKNSLWQVCYSLLTYTLVSLCGAWTQELHETANGTNTNWM